MHSRNNCEIDKEMLELVKYRLFFCVVYEKSGVVN